MAVNFLFNHTNLLPYIHVCRGDYNLHSLQWDTILGVESPQAHITLIATLHSAMGHYLASPLDVITHIPDNVKSWAMVINLIWSDSDLCTKVHINTTGQGLSHHALINVEIATKPWSVLLATLTKELPTLLPSECYPLGILDPHNVPTSWESVEQAVTHLYHLFQNTWNDLAVVNQLSSGPQSLHPANKAYKPPHIMPPYHGSKIQLHKNTHLKPNFTQTSCYNLGGTTSMDREDATNGRTN